MGARAGQLFESIALSRQQPGLDLAGQGQFLVQRALGHGCIEQAQVIGLDGGQIGYRAGQAEMIHRKLHGRIR